MKTLKRIISTYMYKIICILVAVVLAILVLIQVVSEQRNAYEESRRTISQIEIMLEENQQDLEEIKEEYNETCLCNAEIVARVIEGDPEILDDVDELRALAKLIGVDEIHIFDITGRIIKGTHPEYYNLTFDSGEQIMFFKPMLKDKNMKLVQDILPNTAEEKLMQYSAVWSEHGEFILQVGMEPESVTKVMAKNELSYIFSLFRVNPEVSYYAVNANTGEIVGSTELNLVGLNVSDIGFEFKEIIEDENGFHTKVNGKFSFCVFGRSGDNYIGCVTTVENLYDRIPMTAIWIGISLIVVAFLLAKAVVIYMNKYVVKKIDEVNMKLKSIADGNLEENVDIQSSVEFKKLSDYVNSMVKSLLENNKKMSFVLSKTNMLIGTYEYGGNSNKVRYTEFIPEIFGVESSVMEEISLKKGVFIDFISRVKSKPVVGESGVYQKGNQYVRLEENVKDGKVFGVVINVTSDVSKLIQAEKERDVDALTGLYNRRGLDVRLTKLFAEPEKILHSVIIMIDADGLKGINDTYGHEKGDLYLRKIGETISSVGTKQFVAARQGGDEYVLYLYGYDNEESLVADVSKLESLQSGAQTVSDGDTVIPLRFSMGYSIVNGAVDYQPLLKAADEKMYHNKMERKKQKPDLSILK